MKRGTLDVQLLYIYIYMCVQLEVRIEEALGNHGDLLRKFGLQGCFKAFFWGPKCFEALKGKFNYSLSHQSSMMQDPYHTFLFDRHLNCS